MPVLGERDHLVHRPHVHTHGRRRRVGLDLHLQRPDIADVRQLHGRRAGLLGNDLGHLRRARSRGADESHGWVVG